MGHVLAFLWGVIALILMGVYDAAGFIGASLLGMVFLLLYAVLKVFF